MAASSDTRISPVAAPFVQSGGGIKVGDDYWTAWYATTPFVSITLDDAQIDLKVSFFTPLRRYVFPFARVRRLSLYRKWLARGLLIEHSVPEYPPFVLLWSPDLPSLTAALRQRSFHVEGS